MHGERTPNHDLPFCYIAQLRRRVLHTLLPAFGEVPNFTPDTDERSLLFLFFWRAATTKRSRVGKIQR